LRGKAGIRALLRKTRTTPTFNILHRSAARYPTIRQTLVSPGLLATTDTDALTVLEKLRRTIGLVLYVMRLCHRSPDPAELSVAAGPGGIRPLTFGDRALCPEHLQVKTQ
jgi:hypothetical protein